MVDLKLERLVVPVDFSPPSTAALAGALTLAERVGARVEVLHVYQVPSFAFLEAAYIPTAEDAAQIAQSAQSALDTMIGGLKVKHPNVPVSSTLKNGAIVEELLNFADEVDGDWIVMGTHGRGFWSRALLGSSAREVVRRSERPVLTVHSLEGRPHPFEAGAMKILAPIDFDDLSMHSLDIAMGLAKKIGATVRILFSYTVPDAGYPFPDLQALSVVQDAAKRSLQRIVTERQSYGVPLEAATFVGAPASGIVEETKDNAVGLVVMGTHVKGPIERVVAGSVAQDVVRLAPCPVLTVREQKVARAERGAAPRPSNGHTARR